MVLAWFWHGLGIPPSHVRRARGTIVRTRSFFERGLETKMDLCQDVFSFLGISARKILKISRRQSLHSHRVLEQPTLPSGRSARASAAHQLASCQRPEW